MTEAEFIMLALCLPGVEPCTNHSRPGFCLKGRLFAGPGEGRGGLAALKLTPEQQELFCEAEPRVFRPDPSRWGRAGWTNFIVEEADPATAKSALAAAWRNVAPKTLVKQHPDL